MNPAVLASLIKAGGDIASTGINKITGVPTPKGAFTPGAKEGSQYRQFLNKAYPGTTVWEQIGASGAGTAGAIGSGHMSSRVQQQAVDIQKKKMFAELANITANTAKTYQDTKLAKKVTDKTEEEKQMTQKENRMKEPLLDAQLTSERGRNPMTYMQHIAEGLERKKIDFINKVGGYLSDRNIKKIRKRGLRKN